MIKKLLMKRLLLVLILCAPVWGENVWTGDPNCVANWNCEEASPGTYWDDSLGKQNFLSVAASAPNDVYYKQGSQSAYKTTDFLFVQHANGNFDADYPFKSSYANPVKASVCMWVRFTSLPASGTWHALYAHYHSSFNTRQWMMYYYNDAGTYTFRFLKGYNGGGSFDETVSLTGTVYTDRWYHVAVTYDDTTGATRLRVWDDTAGALFSGAEVTETQAHANDFNLSNPESLVIFGTSYPYFDYSARGWFDEIVVFNDVLTSGEIDQIRSGTYGSAAESTTSNWWWRRRHN